MKKIEEDEEEGRNKNIRIWVKNQIHSMNSQYKQPHYLYILENI